jgi:hypothetical protein
MKVSLESDFYKLLHLLTLLLTCGWAFLRGIAVNFLLISLISEFFNLLTLLLNPENKLAMVLILNWTRIKLEMCAGLAKHLEQIKAAKGT